MNTSPFIIIANTGIFLFVGAVYLQLRVMSKHMNSMHEQLGKRIEQLEQKAFPGQAAISRDV
jgi:hypothetical protein